MWSMSLIIVQENWHADGNGHQLSSLNQKNKYGHRVKSLTSTNDIINIVFIEIGQTSL